MPIIAASALVLCLLATSWAEATAHNVASTVACPQNVVNVPDDNALQALVKEGRSLSRVTLLLLSAGEFRLPRTLLVQGSACIVGRTYGITLLAPAAGGRHFLVDAESQLGLARLTLDGGGAGGGAAVDQLATLAAEDTSWIRNGRPGEDGGAIHTFSGTVMLVRSNLTDNSVMQGNTGSGGAIWQGGAAVVTLHHTAVVGNSAGAFGGGIFAKGGTLSLFDSIVSECYANNHGGGICAGFDAVLSLARSQLTLNVAREQGGALHLVQRSSAALSGGTVIRDNTAHLGAAMMVSGSSLALSGPACITANTASGSAAIYATSSSTLDIDGRQQMFGRGSADDATFLVEDSTFLCGGRHLPNGAYAVDGALCSADGASGGQCSAAGEGFVCQGCPPRMAFSSDHCACKATAPRMPSSAAARIAALGILETS